MKYKNSNGQWQTIKFKNYGIEQTPIGSMIYYPSQIIPNGYLVCDGSEVLIADYPLLFNAIGYIGGEDVDTGYFRLPDMRGNVPAGFYEGLDSSNPLAGNFGDQVGKPTHQLTIDELPEHTHAANEDSNYRFTENLDWGTSTIGRRTIAVDNDSSIVAMTANTAAEDSIGTNDITQSATTAATGNSKTHSIVQPTKLYHWLIKAKSVITLGGYTEDFEVSGNLTVNGVNVTENLLNGEEIATNEFFNGKRVYKKLFMFTDTIAGAKVTNIAHNLTHLDKIWVDQSNSFIIQLQGSNKGLSFNFPLHFYTSTTVDACQLNADYRYIIFISDGGWGSSWEKNVVLKYTKNTTSEITFTVGGVSYTAEEGMTWGQFVNSSYSKEEFLFANDYICTATYGTNRLISTSAGTTDLVTYSSVLVDGEAYNINSASPTPA